MGRRTVAAMPAGSFVSAGTGAPGRLGRSGYQFGHSLALLIYSRRPAYPTGHGAAACTESHIPAPARHASPARWRPAAFRRPARAAAAPPAAPAAAPAPVAAPRRRSWSAASPRPAAPARTPTARARRRHRVRRRPGRARCRGGGRTTGSRKPATAQTGRRGRAVRPGTRRRDRTARDRRWPPPSARRRP